MVLLLAIAFSLFFSSEKVQTRVANSITQRIPFFETDIEIGSAKIALTGGVSLEPLIKDHKRHPVFSKRIKTSVRRTRRGVKGNYQLSLTINQPFLYKDCRRV